MDPRTPNRLIGYGRNVLHCKKKVSDFPISSGDVTNQTHPGEDNRLPFLQCKGRVGAGKHRITINVPLFKKLRDIIFFLWDNNFMSHFEGHFEGAKTFLTP